MPKKFRVVFPFVEAGLGHIMPMKAVADAFEKKYGDRTDVIRINFFQETNDLNLKNVEEKLVKEVKLHNRIKGYGSFQVLLMHILGTHRGLKIIMQGIFKKAFIPALEYIKELEADLIVNTHFFTLYYSCEAKQRGLTNAQIAVYCPDPILGIQWDDRGDLVVLSSEKGKKKAQKRLCLDDGRLDVVPFLIRNEVKGYTESKEFYRRELGIPENGFTVLLADGAYGAGKLGKTVRALLKSDKEMTVIAVCGKNEKLFNEFKKLPVPPNINFVLYGFTDKMLMLVACCDLFVGKAGASNLAEPSYFGAPSIITFCATPIERWISDYYVEQVGCAIKCTSINKAISLIEQFSQNPEYLNQYKEACKSQHRSDGAELFADLIWERLHSNQTTVCKGNSMMRDVSVI